MIRNIAQKKLIKKPGSTFRSNQAFWNSGYTHDRDYLAYKKAPKGRAGGRNRPWCLGWWKMVPRGENDGFQYVSTNVWIMSFNVFFCDFMADTADQVVRGVSPKENHGSVNQAWDSWQVVQVYWLGPLSIAYP